MKTVVIESSKLDHISKKICGLYVLERNIIVLSRVGYNKIYLDLSQEEMDFFNRKIKKHVKKANTEIIIDKTNIPRKDVLIVPSDIFIQQHYFNDFDAYFKKSGSNFIPEYNEELFNLTCKNRINKAIKKISKHIIENTGGFIAQKINKRVSIPISIIMSKTRIHPNYLTIVNMFIGLMSSYMIYLCTFDNYSDSQKYIFMVTGGFLFQAASVLDGVDGEVAKFTLKVSKIGGWLDTISDNSTLLLFLISSSYLYYTVVGGIISIVTIGILFIGLAIMLGIMVSYLSKYSESGSLVAYDREFLQKLPEDDKLVRFALSMKYITKKEMFSICFFLVALTGYVYLIIPMASFVLLMSAIILTTIQLKHIKKFAENLKN